MVPLRCGHRAVYSRLGTFSVSLSAYCCVVLCMSRCPAGGPARDIMF
jgi:hypothetical protein